jgi:nucleoid DNA-binding protein
MEIRNCIADLLSEHDCVIIPGFGGFIGSYTPARIDPVTHTFQPPAKQLLFNINLRHNDGLLAHLITSESECSYPEAIRIIEEFVTSINQQLYEGESVHFNRVGRIFPGEEGNLLFEQHKTANLFSGSFGLQSFISPPVQRSGSFRQFQKKNQVSPMRPSRKGVVRKWMRMAAFLAVPLGIAILLGLMKPRLLQNQLTSGQKYFHSLVTRFSKTARKTKSVVKTQETSVLPISEVVSGLVEDTASGAVSTTVAETSSDNEQVGGTLVNKAPYAVIIGAFRLEDNAEKLVNELVSQGNEALIFDQSRSGLYRVALGTFSDQREALKLLEIARSGDFPGAWLLKN